MKLFFYKLWAKFLTFFGDIKIFRFPFWTVLDPDDFQVTGEKTVEIMKILQPGDIILRGYNKYLDGKFVPDKLAFSHGGLYAGDNIIIHAVAEGVSEINVVDFTRCDRIAIIRPKKGKVAALKKAREFLKNKVPYDFGFRKGVSAVYCFELCGECYEKLQIPRYTVKKFLGLVRRKNVFLAESFFKSPDMDCIFHWNPKFNINFVK